MIPPPTTTVRAHVITTSAGANARYQLLPVEILEKINKPRGTQSRGQNTHRCQNDSRCSAFSDDR
jgi:hypothetical protein